MKLKKWFYATLLTASLIPLLICGLLMLRQNNRNVEKVVEKSLLGISESQIAEIENFFLTIKQDAEIISDYSFLQNEVLASLGLRTSDGNNVAANLEELLIERKNYRAYIETMAIVNAQFRLVASSGEYAIGGITELGNVNPKYLTGEFWISDTYIRETASSRKPFVFACSGIFSEEQLIGYIVIEIPADYFAKYHEDNVFWEHGVMKIMDGAANVVTVGGGGDEEVQFELLQTNHDRKVERDWNNNQGKEFGSVSYKLSGENYISTYSKLDYSDWTIRITANIDAYCNTGTSYLLMLVAMVVILLMVLMILSYFLTRHIILPIERIKETLKKVQETQDYSIHIESESENELGELQHEINRLLQCVLVAQMQDKEEQMYLEKKAEKDPMTGVMNKKAIAQCVQQMVKEVEIRNGKLAVGFIDIDNFRDYNTKYGHAEGDHVIKFVANTLREMIPGVVGRNGGDEFVFCMEADEREIVEQVVNRLMRKLQEGIVNSVTEERMPVPCSIGIVIDKAENADSRKLIQEADEAMYQAKGNGKNTYYIMMK